MSKADKILAPRDAATDEEDAADGSQPGSDYDTDGSLDAENPVPVKTEEVKADAEAEGAVESSKSGSDEEEEDDDDEDEEDEEEEEEEEEGEEAVEKENLSSRGGLRQKQAREPYEVPTTGAFYMHDDRFAQETPAPARPPARKNRRGIEENKWKHDKFAELERQFEQGKPVVRGRRTNFGRGRRGRYRNDPHSTRHERAVTNVVAEPTPQLESREFDPYQDSVVQQPDMDSGDRWKKNSDMGPRAGNGGRSRSNRGGRGRSGGRGYSSRGR